MNRPNLIKRVSEVLSINTLSYVGKVEFKLVEDSAINTPDGLSIERLDKPGYYYITLNNGEDQYYMVDTEEELQTADIENWQATDSEGNLYPGCFIDCEGDARANLEGYQAHVERELSCKCGFDIDLAKYESSEEVREYFEECNPNNSEVIYYSNAMKYLSENDQSLNESINIALELGYELDNVNSELLATLLNERNNQEAFSELTDIIETYFELLDI